MPIITPKLMLAGILSVLIGGGVFFIKFKSIPPLDPSFSLSPSGQQVRNVSGITPPTETDVQPRSQNTAIKPRSNLTSDIGRSIATSFLNDNPSLARGIAEGTDSTEVSIESPIFLGNLVDEVGNAIEQSDDLFHASVYHDEYTTTPDDSSASQRAYLHAVSNLIRHHFEKSENPLATIGAALSNQNNNRIDNEIENIRSARESIRSIAVPPSWFAFHIEVISILKEEEEVFIAIKRVNDDPTTALAAVSHQQQLLFRIARLNDQALEALE